MPAQLGRDDAIAALEAQEGAVEFLHQVMTLLDRLFRSTINPFGTAATVNTGTTEGTVPVLGAGGKLAAARLPALIPASKITTGTFAPGQIPAMYPRKFTSGVLSLARIAPASIPVHKIQDITADGRTGTGVTIPPENLPIGYSLTRWPTSVAAGGPGVQNADGVTIGTNAPIVSTVRGQRPGEAESTTRRTQGGFRASDGSLRVQIRVDYVRTGYNSGAWIGDAPIPDRFKIPPEPDPGGPGDPDMPQPPTNGNGNNPPPPHG